MAQILIVDDDAAAREVLGESLRAHGHLVSEASDGNEGLRRLREEPCGLVIIDLFMPGKEGLGTIREIRAGFDAVKIIAISGGGSRGELEYLPIAERFGADRVLAKPFEQSLLIETVADLIGLGDS